MSDNDLDLPEFENQKDTQDANALTTTGGQEAQILDEDGGVKAAADLQTVFDVPVNISAVLGKTYMDVASLLKLNAGTVLELDRKVGEAIDIYVNNRLVARGEIVLVEERLGVTMTEIIKDNGAN